MATKKTILVIYFQSTWGYPLRDTIKTHLFSWKNYSKHRVIYINIAFGFPEQWARKINIDTIIFHTSFAAIRWNELDTFKIYTEKCAYLKEINCQKIIMPQDEWLYTDMLNDFINDFGITHILTVSFEEDWHKIYDKIDFNKVSLKTILTGYLDPGTLKRIKKRKVKVKTRDIDIGYRAWKAEYWLGEHGMHKVWIANIFNKASKERKLKTDISLQTNYEYALKGDDWFDYLLRCKATIGVEGGASLLDKHGDIRRKVEEYLKEHPQASFEETRTHCFLDEDHKLGFKPTSPRHLEACATETCQFLIEGRYNDILLPWKHYIPVKKDYSNIDEVLNILQDTEQIRKITQTAYDDIVKSGKWTYQKFVREIETSIIDKAEPVQQKGSIFSLIFTRYTLALIDYFNWQIIRLEVKSQLNVNDPILQIIVSEISSFSVEHKPIWNMSKMTYSMLWKTMEYKYPFLARICQKVSLFKAMNILKGKGK